MAHTSQGRVILGGLLAGLVINTLDAIVNGVFLAKAWAQAMQALGYSSVFAPTTIVIFWIWGFLFGIGSVWMYAAIRPRYGAGVLTAVRAGIVAWGLGIFLPNMALYPMHVFRGRLLAMATAAALIEIVVGTVLGAWIYKEKEAPAVRSAAA